MCGPGSMAVLVIVIPVVSCPSCCRSPCPCHQTQVLCCRCGVLGCSSSVSGAGSGIRCRRVVMLVVGVVLPHCAHPWELVCIAVIVVSCLHPQSTLEQGPAGLESGAASCGPDAHRHRHRHRLVAAGYGVCCFEDCHYNIIIT
jgi:hypothetical protein